MLRRLMTCCGLAGLLSLSAIGLAGEIDYREDFALSNDRAATLKQLVPGTEDYYYYHALHYQQTEQFEKAAALMQPWAQRHGETPRYQEIRTRGALLAYRKNPQATLEYLRQRLNLTYPDRRIELNVEPNLPTELDQKRIAWAKLAQVAYQNSPDTLAGFEDRALERLLTEKLSPERRRNLLSRLQRPDHADLVRQIVDDLNYQRSGGFGSLGIHRKLLLSQLDEALKLKPDLLNEQNFVQAYLVKLQPNADESWKLDRAVLAAYLTRLEAFADRLAPVHNSLKAHVLYHRLVLERLQGNYDQARFLKYLALPRSFGYVSPRMLESEALRLTPCDPNATFDGAKLLPPIGNDEPLVRDYLAHFLVDAANPKTYEPYINDVYLARLFAETKIINGLGEAEQWASALPPEMFKQLKDRVDLDFVPTNKTRYGADEAVRLQLDVKNVDTLIVKVFEINTQNYYRTQISEIDTDINLDGLVANIEQTKKYAEAPLRRVRRTFEFPELTKPGVYVVDFIGNGRGSRALVRKGDLKHIVRTTGAGRIVTILDEKNTIAKNGVVWFGGQDYRADEKGNIVIPFSANPGNQPVVLTATLVSKSIKGIAQTAELSTLARLETEAESYTLSAGIYVDREELLKRKKATVVIRPSVRVNGVLTSVKLLEEVKLRIVATDLDGTVSTQEIENVKLFEDRETTHEFQVPPRLAALSFTLLGKIPQLTTGGTKVDLADSSAVSLNDMDRTDKTEDAHLLLIDGAYVVELLGKTGESRASKPMQIVLKHRDFNKPVNVMVKTNAAGRILLGALDGIVSISLQTPQGVPHQWMIRPDRHTYSSSLHAKAGDSPTIPYLPYRSGDALDPGAKPAALSHEEVSFIELRGGTFFADRFDRLKVVDGLLTMDKLPAGDYDLLLKSDGQHILVRVAAGETLLQRVFGAFRTLELQPLAALQIESVKTEHRMNAPAPEPPAVPKEVIAVRLKNATKFTRVHVFATRYYPEYDAFAGLLAGRDLEPFYGTRIPAESVYLTGRNIGDEYRYIIDRRYATKFPGNMLARPSLLLNPWAVRETETGEQIAQGGDDFGGLGQAIEAFGSRAKSEAVGKGGGGLDASRNFASLDFLAVQSAAILNLIPDEQGLIVIDRAAIGPHQHLTIVAVDPTQTTQRTYALPERRTIFEDLRLTRNLDPKTNYALRKQVEILPGDAKFVLPDVAVGKFQIYDSLPAVHGLFTALNQDAQFAEFAFVLNWPKLKDEEKREKYSKYACHELHLFLAKKDPEFFKVVVKPYLANKKDKTFVDHYLLEDDLSDYLQPWRYSQLNVVEKVLLSQRIDGERKFTARRIDDLYAMLPPNSELDARIFETGILSGALDTGDRLGLRKNMEESLKRSTSERFSGAGDKAAGEDHNKLSDLSVGRAMPAVIAPPAAESAPSARDALSPDAARRELEELGKGKKRSESKDEKSDRQRLGEANGKPVDGPVNGFIDADGLIRERKVARQLYRKLDKTKEWAENNYYHLTIDRQTAELVTVNAFWKDYAAHDATKPFLSKNFGQATRNFTEMMFALAILDLPFESPKHKTEFDADRMTLTGGGAAIVFHEQIEEAAAPEATARVLVSQNVFRHGDRHRMENGEQVDKFIEDEYLTNVVYGCHIVATNPTSTRQKLNVLLQIPRGAISVLAGQATKTVPLTIEPYHTQTLEYYFYFPQAGEYPHYPVHISKDDRVIAAAPARMFKVVDKPSKVDTGSWDYVSQYGTDDEVLAYLDRENTAAIDLDKIAWRMADKAMFQSVIARLAKMHVYQNTLWSYALKHGEVVPAREFLKHAQKIVAECGGRIASELLTIDPVERRTYQHLEYSPLVNARAHSLGKNRRIVNEVFFQQYLRFLHDVGYAPTLTVADRLDAVYYLLLQDRIDEGLAMYERVKPDSSHTRLQYDYLTAYLAMSRGEMAPARAIADKYAKYPVDRWQKTFAAVIATIDEAEGKAGNVVDPENREERQAELAATQPGFDFAVEAGKIALDSRNLDAVRINYYEMDVELLFSRNPFVQQFQGEFGSIRPNLTQTVELAKDKPSHALPLPEQFKGKNVIVEITAAGTTKTVPYYANSLNVQTIEQYGQVKIAAQVDGKPIAKAYVKVYVRLSDGTVKFYKDGYTDVRGRFDYSSLNTNELESASRFAILIMSDDHGAVVREAAPPQR